MLVSPLAEKNLRKAVSKFGTMPKNARIDAYLESMSSQADNEQPISPNANPEYSGGLSDDSLDAIPASYSNGWSSRLVGFFLFFFREILELNDSIFRSFRYQG